MVEWKTFDPSALFPDELANLLNVTEPLADTLGTALDIMADVVDVASLFVSGFVDAQAAAIAAVQDAIASVVQQLTQTGVYYLTHMPPSYSGKLSISSWTTQVANSLTDYSDEARPILTDPNAYVSAIAVVAVASTYKGLLSDYRKMFDTFSKRIANATQISRWRDRNDVWIPTVGIGQAPDWGSKKLGDIVPPIGEIAKKMQSFSDSVTSASGGSEIYNAFAEQLRDKASLLTSFADQISGFLSELENSLNWEGAYVLPIYGQGDAAWLKNILINSRGGPWDVVNGQYTAGFMFLTTGGTSSQVDLLFDLFGLPKEVSEIV